jgi:mannose-6-phosphate isomerase-like protein (cupin superfamily)
MESSRWLALALLPVIGLAALSDASFAAGAPPFQATAVSPPGGVGPTAQPTFREATSGALMRNLAADDKLGKLSVSVEDMIVGPGRTARLAADASADILIVQSGQAQVTVDGQAVEIKPLGSITAAAGQSLDVDNTRSEIPFRARLYRLRLTQP